MTTYKTIADLPAAGVSNDTDLFETSQAGLSWSVTLGQMSASIMSDVAGILASGGATPLSSVAALKALTIRPSVVITRGYNAVNDGGGGPPWVWVAGSTAAADDFMVVSPAGPPTGRYIRQFQAGAAVSPRWAGCGLGAADDSVQFQKVVNFGRAVDASGGTYPILNVQILDGATACPGIFSDGTATFVPAPGSTSTNYLFFSNKLSGFCFRRLRFIGPISTDPLTPPTCGRPIYFDAQPPLVSIDNEASDCHIEGFINGVVCNGAAKNYRVARNYITQTWADAIVGPHSPVSAWIVDNTLYDGGYATGAQQPSGAIRIGTFPLEVSGEVMTITGNHISNYCINTGQSTIDCFSSSLALLDISNNVTQLCGSGIELKTIDNAPGAGSDVYGHFTICNNTIRLLSAPTTQFGYGTSGLYVFFAGAVTTAKATRVVVEGNNIGARTRPQGREGILGVFVSGYRDVSISGNTITNVNVGIQLAGTGGVAPANTALGIYVSGNTIDAIEAAIYKSADIVTGLYINGNPLIKSEGSGVIVAGGLTNDLQITGNIINSRATSGIELQNVAGGLVGNNSVTAGSAAVLSQAVAISNVVIENNRLRTFVDQTAIPMNNVAVVSPGAGLTNGVRTFTVTSGTGTSPIIFRCNVVGGTISGGIFEYVQRGSYSVFPVNPPTVTVDSGIIGGAVFNVFASVASHALDLRPAGSGNVVQLNTVDVPTAFGTVHPSSGGFVSANNCRGQVAVIPTIGGSLGDIFLNSTPTSGGFEKWICTTTGTTGVAVWKGCGVIA